MKNIWPSFAPGATEGKPILIQAPMEGVTDTVFRQIIASCGKPDVFFTEFTNVDAIEHWRLGYHSFAAVRQSQVKSGIDKLQLTKRAPYLNSVSKKEYPNGRSIAARRRYPSPPLENSAHEALRRLYYTKVERPIVAQIWGNKPENYYQAVKLIIEMGFDGVDINMGCPVWGIVEKGFCAGLINNPDLAKEIIEAAKKGADGKIPVSVKTRIGYSKIETEEWIGYLLKQGLDAIIVHGRTAKNRSKTTADWEEIGKAVLLRNKLGAKTAIIGNGDVKSRAEAIEKWKRYEVDGVMIGRGILENPWVFSKAAKRRIIANGCAMERSIMSRELKIKKLKLLIKHIELFKKTYSTERNFAVMKKFYKTYVNGFRGAIKLRTQLLDIKTPNETIDEINKYLANI